MKKLVQFILSVVTLFLLAFLTTNTVSANDLNANNIIDSITFSDTQLSQGQTSSIQVKFSEKNNTQINPGDSFTIPLPSGLQGMVEAGGQPRVINLTGLGEALIYKDRVVATFNDNVKHLNNVTGNFSFGFTSSVTNSEQDNTIETNFGHLVPAQKIVVKGVSRNTGTGIYPFFYKVGDLLGASDTVRWFLNANLNKVDLHNDIVITDTHGAGQLLNKDSINISVDNYLGSHSYSLTEFLAKGFGTITFKNGNTFTLRIWQQHARLASFTVMYTSNITEDGKNLRNLENSYTVNYQLWNKQPVSEKNTSKVKNLFANGEAHGDLDDNKATENEIIVEEETTETIDEIVTDNANETVTEDNTGNAVITQPEINVPVTEEVVDEETTETIDETVTDNANETVTEDNTGNVVITQPEINVPVTEEVIEEETTETIDEVVTDNANETVTEDNTGNAVITQPEINVPVTEEVIKEETTETIDEIVTDNANETVTEDNTGNVVITQPEINVSVTEEVIEEETTETIDETVTEDNTGNAVITQPEINVPVTEEVIEEETTETIDEIITDNADETVTEDNTGNVVITQPEIKDVKSEVTSQEYLPKTGSSNSITSSLVGLLISATTIFTFYTRRKETIEK